MFQVLYRYKDHYEILTDDTYGLQLMQICMYICLLYLILKWKYIHKL